MAVTFWQIAAGRIVSLTRTEVAQVAEFPFISVTFNITGFVPTEEQLKEEGETEIMEMLQASLELELTEAAARVAAPAAFKYTVAFWQTALGRIVSRTVTDALQEDEFPLMSVTVKVIEFPPAFEQLTNEGEAVIPEIPQESELRLFIEEERILAEPDELR